MAKNNGIVNGQSKLQYHRHRIRDEADGSAEEIRAHIQQCGSAEGHQQHRHFHIGPGSQSQYQQDDGHRHQQNHQHLLVQQGIFIVAHQSIDGVIIRGGDLPDFLQGLQRCLVEISAGEVHIIQGRRLGIMLRGIIKGDHSHPVQS